jgi:drug/metabolite transporter (DMT)-like permease
MESGVVLGELAAIASAAIWAFSSLAMAGLARRMPAITVSALRLTFGVLFYVGALIVTGHVSDLFHLGFAHVAALGVTAVLAMGLGDTLFIVGMQAIGVSRASPISVTSYPMLTLLLAWAILGEQVSVNTIIGGALVVGGIVLIVARKSPTPSAARSQMDVAELAAEPASVATVAAEELSAAVLTAPPVEAAPVVAAESAPILKGLILVLAAAVAWSLSTVWLRSLSENTSPVVVNSVRVPIAALLMAGFAESRGLLDLRRYRVRDLLLLVGMGFVGTGLGSLTYVYALDKAGAGRSALLNSLSPVFALPLAAVFLGERLTRQTLAGTLIALAGVWLVIG